ncbi:MAG: endonuclease/exonuclease/phosphatase family protein, partial [Planctomycetaceae bacterium]|nr:endonuclease/exonuclease/phosphatase family protein [Planctomycetaceae bacterium]
MRPTTSACVLVFVTLLSVGVGLADDPPRKIRVATFNVSLVGREPKEIAETLRSGDDPKARAIAEIIQRVDPDILLINELDYDDENLAIER